jgi:hypothetical protein
VRKAAQAKLLDFFGFLPRLHRLLSDQGWRAALRVLMHREECGKPVPAPLDVLHPH